MERRSDGEEEVAMVNVDNAAATSVFSPNMWVRKPYSAATKSRLPDGMELYTGSKPGQLLLLQEDKENAAEALITLAHSPPAPKAHHLRKRSRDDLDLAYLEAPDRDNTEKEQTENDLAHISAIRDEIHRARETTKSLEAQYVEVAEALAMTRTQSDGMMRLLTGLGVQSGDFVMCASADVHTKKRRMVEIGARLVFKMCEQRTQPIKPRRGRPPLHAQVHSATPGPSSTGGLVGNEGARLEFTSPVVYPAQAQIAAAALTHSQGDPAVALLSLVEKALAARVPRTAVAAPVHVHVPPSPIPVLSSQA